MRNGLLPEARTLVTRPVLLCYDGSDRAEQAIRRSGALLDDLPAIVLYGGRECAHARGGRAPVGPGDRV